MYKIRAIYINDTNFNNCPVFELQFINDRFKFVMLDNNKCAYDVDCVIEDNDWIFFKISNDKVEKCSKDEILKGK